MSGLGNKEIMAKNIKKYMEEKGMNVADLSSILGFPYTTVASWLKAENYPRIDKIEKMANLFGVKKSDLVEDKIDSLISSLPELHPIQSIRPVPILGEIACGTPIFCEENFDGYVGIDTARMKGEFALYCHGNSMIEAGITEGDLVLLRKTPDVENGTIAAVYIDGEATLKKIYRDGNNIVLQPCNKDYSPIVISMKEAEEKDVFIIGECIGVYHEM